MKEKTHLGNRLLSVLLTFLMLLSLLPSAALAADTQQIALMAVTQNGFLIEPEYVTYHSGDTVKDELKKSSHKCVVVGESYNDLAMFEEADISIAFGGVHQPVPALLERSDYFVPGAKELCALLRLLQ